MFEWIREVAVALHLVLARAPQMTNVTVRRGSTINRGKPARRPNRACYVNYADVCVCVYVYVWTPGWLRA